VLPAAQEAEHVGCFLGIRRLAENFAIDHHHSVGADGNEVRIPRRDDARLLAREPFDMTPWHFTRTLGFVDVGGTHLVRDPD
jgi:hypothetical protein